MDIKLVEKGLTGEIRVYDTGELFGEKGIFRVLEFADEAVQGAVDLNRPGRVLFEYPRAMIHLMDVNRPSFEALFIIGHGVGTIAGHYREKRVKSAELDGRIAGLSRTWFGYEGGEVLVGDGRLLLEKEPSGAYDYILVDAFSESGTPGHLVSREFAAMAAEKLDSRGALLLNLMGRAGPDRFINSVHTTLKDVFPYVRTFGLPGESSSDRRNRILMGSRMPIRYEARQMAGFKELEPDGGCVLRDRD